MSLQLRLVATTVDYGESSNRYNGNESSRYGEKDKQQGPEPCSHMISSTQSWHPLFTSLHAPYLSICPIWKVFYISCTPPQTTTRFFTAVTLPKQQCKNFGTVTIEDDGRTEAATNEVKSERILTMSGSTRKTNQKTHRSLLLHESRLKSKCLSTQC